MITLSLGRTGAGKSYETVVYQILPALKEGRKVITNMPLNISLIESVYPQAVGLIDIRQVSKTNPRPFSTLADFGDEWRDPETNRGPLYVIDECHKAFPSGRTPIAIEEWFAESRHEGADVHLLTQSHRKVSRAIVDLVDIMYRLIKARMFGSDSRYIRKVFDGIHGTEIDTSIRHYEHKWFPFYQSHTKSAGAVVEASAKDVKPIWQSWPFIGTGIAAALLVGMLVNGATLNPFSAAQVDTASSERVMVPVRRPEILQADPVQPGPDPGLTLPNPVEVVQPKNPDHPFSTVGLHISGHIRSADRSMYSFDLSQNGQRVARLLEADLVEAGYSIEPMGSCAVKLHHGDWSAFVLCNAPSQSIM